MEKTHTFTKAERLCSKKLIESLFQGGAKSFSIYPMRVVFIPIEKRDAQVSILISVPKKRFKRAVKRNLIKRQIREAYRLQKDALLKAVEEKEYGLAIAFIYISNDIFNTEEIMAKMKTTLARITESLE